MSKWQTVNSDEFKKFDDRFRARFINSLSGFKSANLVGTQDSSGKANLSVISSVFHLGANPALIAFVSRPPVVERHTYDNIIENPFFTINHISADFYQNAHQCSARYPKEVSEFDATGFTVETSKFKAPYVQESPLKLGCHFLEKISIELNKTVIMIGEIQEVHFYKSALQPDGFLDLEQLNVCAVSGLDSYHTTQRLSRLNYAKPEMSPFEIPLSGE